MRQNISAKYVPTYSEDQLDALHIKVQMQTPRSTLTGMSIRRVWMSIHPVWFAVRCPARVSNANMVRYWLTEIQFVSQIYAKYNQSLVSANSTKYRNMNEHIWFYINPRLKHLRSN